MPLAEFAVVPAVNLARTGSALCLAAVTRDMVGDSRPMATAVHGKSINDRLRRGVGCRF